jgi:hypothetical protein
MAKCVDCGLVCARNPETRQLEEVPRDYRKTGRPPGWLVGGHDLWNHRELGTPLCLDRIYDLFSEFEAETVGKDEEKCLRILGKERKCLAFTDWQQGSTPKEHREMMDRERFEKRQTDREEADRKWRSRQDLKLVLIAGFFTILGALLAYLLGAAN